MTGILNLLMGTVRSAAVVTDPYFEYTTLLLPGSGTNGAQNNTFLDGSTNNFTITRNGNTTQGTFSPFSQTGWGNYFDGTTDYLSVANNAALNLGSSNYTIECWFYAPSAPTANDGIFTKGNTTSVGTEAWSLEFVNSSGNIGFGVGAFNSFASYLLSSSTAATLNAWNHIAVVRNGTAHTMYLNGVSVATATASYTVTSAGSLYLGTGWYAPSTRDFIGYISNARLVIGTAVYTGAFTPPTSPLEATQSAGTNISAITGTQTSLLTCQSNRFIDNSTNNFTITRNGDTRVVAFSPFNPTASWSAATYGGSGYFDGSGDYLTVPAQTALSFAGDFTIETWIYITSNPSTNYGLLDARTSAGTLAAWVWDLFNSSGTKLDFIYGAARLTSASTVPINQWVHLVVSRVGSTIRQFINGTVDANTATTSAAINASRTDIYIGNLLDASTALPGYMSGIRVVNGSGVTSVTVPTSPPTAVSGTSLLLNFTNAGIYDATSKNDLETVGNAQISTAQYKFPPSSMAFDGTGDYLDISPSRFSSFGTGNFTVEFWMRTAGSVFNIINPATATGTGYWALLVQTGIGGFRWNDAYDVTNLWTQTATSVLDNNWHHIAVVRNGTGSGNVNIYFDGVAQGTAKTDSTNYNGASTAWRIGSGNVGALNGYIQDLRITPGIARYTANFTPPTAAFPTL